MIQKLEFANLHLKVNIKKNLQFAVMIKKPSVKYDSVNIMLLGCCMS